MKPGEYCWICGIDDHKAPDCPKKNTPKHLWVKNLKKNIRTTQAQHLQNQAITMQAQLMAVPTTQIQVPSSSASTSDGRSAATGIQTQFSNFTGSLGQP